MTHQVLARKWRPRSFQQVVGQESVVRALTNALDQQRLHHAYLFTGTRGVGKTSLARLLAKCLNCEQGVSSSPCGQCQNCRMIDQGRFLDLIEVDAASRTKVEDTRDLLDNVQYAPTQGRYKVYIIDEVHMLSNHSFNALLKTLEEPPPHVKFLLATTDPQRLPITVLSRCLQFHLKNLSVEQISQQLGMILTAEQVTYEAAALKPLAQAAQGSMRDALSLLDQAIAYGKGALSAQDIKILLGATEPELLLSLLTAVCTRNSQQALHIVHELAESAADFPHALEELLSLLHQVAIEQAVPGMAQESVFDATIISALASQLRAEEVQLFYQIGLTGRRDLPLAPTPRSGFEMLVLRLLAFWPQTQPIEAFLANATSEPMIKQRQTPLPATPLPKAAPVPAPTQTTKDWPTLLAQLSLHGAAQVVASHCSLVQQTNDTITLALDAHHSALLNKKIQEQIAKALEQHYQQPLQLMINIGKSEQETPASLDKKRQDHRQYQATEAITEDIQLQTLMDQFSATLIPNSIQSKE